jgi:peptidoglycan-associated lipoprotein
VIKLMRYIAILTVMVTLTACEFAPLKKAGDDTAAQKGEGTQSAITDSPEKYASGGSLEVSSLNDPNSPLSQRVLYFDLDSSQVREDDREILRVHAEFLAAHPEISIVLEGHTDERGTREYNIALGEKRAKAVKQLLTLQGVADKQIQVISFGEERPVALGHDNAAWNLNRRVEILYSGY